MPASPAPPPEKSAQNQRRAPQKRATQTRRKILDAARELIAAQGYEDSRTQDIARLAGIAEGSVFAHFGSKKGLLHALMQDHYAMLIARAQEITARQPAPRQRLAMLIDLHLQELLRSWQLVRVFAHYGRYCDASMTPAFRHLNRDYTRVFQTCLEALIAAREVAPGLRPDMLRDMIFGSAEHWAFRVSELGQPLDRAEAVAFLVGRVLAVPAA
ncbi:TetR/AcrR family transcriptional regulator [Shimia sp.]|uniref:TetR/AcrR family transcriptional regulator n=1 Tax=Shimia sp. TaxID=1954381 RepID=UPI003565CA16